MKKLYLSPTILSSSLESLESAQKSIQLAESCAVHSIHIDVMDGTFVETKSPFNEVSFLKKLKFSVPIHIHAMVSNPDDRYLEFVHAGAAFFYFHIEASKHPEVTMHKLHKWHVKAGLAINPDTPIEQLLPYLPIIDAVLVMSVHPGKSGQNFLPVCLQKISFIHKNYPNLPIAVDGGINLKTGKMVIDAGATTLIADSSIFGSADPIKMIENFKNLK